MLNSKWEIGSIIVLAVLLCGCGASKVQHSGFLSTYDNLQPVQGQEETFLRYVAPDNVLAKYSSIIVDPVTVQFYDQDTAKSLKPEDLDHLKQFFYARLVEKLRMANFNLVNTPGPGVARLRIAITNLKKSTPALNVLPQTKLTGIGLGQVTAEGEIVDSQTGQQLAAVIKSDTGNRFTFDGLSNWGDVEAVMTNWAQALANRLEAAREAMKGT